MAFLTPTTGPIPRGSSWCPDDATLGYRIVQSEQWLSFLRNQQSGDLREAELPHAEKLTLQRGGAYGWDVFLTGLGLPGGGSLAPALREIGTYVKERFPFATPEWTRIPRGTNSGAPTYGMSDTDKLYHALLAAQITDWESAQTVYRQHARTLEAISEIHAITFSRTGPTRKAIDIYDWRGGSLEVTAQATSAVPRRRAVFGVPSFLNIAMLGASNQIKYGMLRLPWTAHPNEIYVWEAIEAAKLNIGPDARVFSDDISGFDLSVRRKHQIELADHVYREYWDGAQTDLWLGAQQMPILGGPIHVNAKGYLYYRPHGGATTSGIITTTSDGTYINLARVVICTAAACGWTVPDAFRRLKARQWDARVWGDDTVLTVPPSFNEDKYREESLALGYTSALIPGATFLMRYYDFTRRAVYPLATRILQQTFWNEKGGRSEAIELLGLYSRTTGFEMNPHHHMIWEMLGEDAPIMKKWNVHNRMSIERTLADPGFRLILAQDVKANPRFLADLIGRAERHPEERDLLAWISHILGPTSLDSGTMDITRPLALAHAVAHRRSLELSSYLATPVDDRPREAAWIKELSNEPELDYPDGADSDNRE
jgi:hypothetical protein